MLKKIRNRESTSNIENVMGYLNVKKPKTDENNNRSNANIKSNQPSIKNFFEGTKQIIRGTKIALNDNNAILSYENKENWNRLNLTNLQSTKSLQKSKYI